MKQVLTSLTNFFKDKAKVNFWLYTLPIQLVGWSILPIMAYNGDWNYAWIGILTYFLFFRLVTCHHANDIINAGTKSIYIYLHFMTLCIYYT